MEKKQNKRYGKIALNETKFPKRLKSRINNIFYDVF